MRGIDEDLRRGIDHPTADLRVFRPGRNKPPAHKSQVACAVLTLDCRDRLRQRRVVAQKQGVSGSGCKPNWSAMACILARSVKRPHIDELRSYKKTRPQSTWGPWSLKAAADLELANPHASEELRRQKHFLGLGETTASANERHARFGGSDLRTTEIVILHQTLQNVFTTWCRRMLIARTMTCRW